MGKCKMNIIEVQQNLNKNNTEKKDKREWKQKGNEKAANNKQKWNRNGINGKIERKINQKLNRNETKVKQIQKRNRIQM